MSIIVIVIMISLYSRAFFSSRTYIPGYRWGVRSLSAIFAGKARDLPIAYVNKKKKKQQQHNSNFIVEEEYEKKAEEDDEDKQQKKTKSQHTNCQGPTRIASLQQRQNCFL
jgi:hypothetical protein